MKKIINSQAYFLFKLLELDQFTTKEIVEQSIAATLTALLFVTIFVTIII
tara:strand:+ start:15471 stop:15620 length:150 start_codon:yes stop_codon:yes gene_type:complete